MYAFRSLSRYFSLTNATSSSSRFIKLSLALQIVQFLLHTFLITQKPPAKIKFGL